MFNTEDTYEVVIFSIGDTKAGTKMGKLQLKNTKKPLIVLMQKFSEQGI